MEPLSESNRKLAATIALTAAITSFISLTVEAIWKPFANNVVENVVDELSIKLFGDEWSGIYSEPVVPLNQRVRPQEGLSTIEHKRSIDSWKIKVNSNGILRGTFTEENNGRRYTFEAVGMMREGADWLVLAFRGPDIGRGTIYLTKTQNEYYRGYATLCDCHSPKPPSYMTCPYVLYKNSDTGAAQAAQNDPIISEKCIPKRID